MELKTKKRLGSKTNLGFGSQDASNFTRRARQHDKLPPPIAVPTSALTPDFHCKPNYMKSTISADARREQANMRRNNHLDVTNSSKNLTNELAGIRTLMKRDASFTPERTLVRKDPPDTLRRSLQVERVTCSSTLKGFKSPECISNGETESEGTWGVKVCSYSHCSLNAHVHALFPPLNNFVSARRPRRCQSPVERPTRNNRNSAKLIGRDEGATSKGGEICCDIDSRENLEENGNLNSRERVDATHVHEKYNEVIVAVDASPQYLAQEANNEILERHCRGCMPNVNLHELDSQSFDMDREKGKHYPTYVDDYECTPKMEEEAGEQGGTIIASDEFIMKPDERLGSFFDDFFTDEVSQESFDEESLNSDTLFTGDGCDSVGSYNYLESLCSKKPSALVLVPVPEAAPVCKNDPLFEGSQTPRTCSQNGETTMGCNTTDGEEHELKDESLPNEDPTIEMANQVPHPLEGPAEEMATSVDSAMCKDIKHNQDHAENQRNPAENFNGESTKNLTNEPYPEFSRKNSSEAECKVVREVNSRNMETPETEDVSSIQATAKCKKSNQEADGPACYNPQEPNFLPLESDPEAEKVNLRHQELNARKNAEEWMVDYALREAVTKIGPARQRKVATLVEAFERVLPTNES